MSVIMSMSGVTMEVSGCDDSVGDRFPTAGYSLGLKLSIPIMIYLSTSIVCKFLFDVGSHNPLSRS